MKSLSMQSVVSEGGMISARRGPPSDTILLLRHWATTAAEPETNTHNAAKALSAHGTPTKKNGHTHTIELVGQPATFNARNATGQDREKTNDAPFITSLHRSSNQPAKCARSPVAPPPPPNAQSSSLSPRPPFSSHASFSFVLPLPAVAGSHDAPPAAFSDPNPIKASRTRPRAAASSPTTPRRPPQQSHAPSGVVEAMWAEGAADASDDPSPWLVTKLKLRPENTSSRVCRWLVLPSVWRSAVVNQGGIQVGLDGVRI